jgi:hypothetical protein
MWYSLSFAIMAGPQFDRDDLSHTYRASPFPISTGKMRAP